MTLSILGLGTALPPNSISQKDAASIARGISCEAPEHERVLPVLYRRTGVSRRHSVILKSDSGPYEERQAFYITEGSGKDRSPSTAVRMTRYELEAAPMAERAVRAALADADVAADCITDLVTVSCSGFAAPGFDVSLIRNLGMSPEVSRTHVGFMGCHGALNGLRVAHSLAARDPRRVVLVCAVELCSLHHQYGWNPEQIVANALFADGAAALVCRSEVNQPSDSKNDAASRSWRLVDSGSTLLGDCEDAMSWRIGDHGFEMTLSPAVPDLISQHLRPWLEAWLGRHDLSIADVGSWAVHPGGPRIVSAVGKSLDLSKTQLAPSLGVLADYGNMSSPTVLFILDRLRRDGASRPAVAVGFGPGLAVETALLE